MGEYLLKQNVVVVQTHVQILPFLTTMMFKGFLICVFWGQNGGPGWVENNKKSLFLYQPPCY